MINDIGEIDIEPSGLDCRNTEVFDSLRNKRRDATFPAFTRNTDEKNQTIKITASFLDDNLPKLLTNLSVTINDWGVGDGLLSAKIASYFQHSKHKNISYKNIIYQGIDQSIDFVIRTRSNLFSLGIDQKKIVLGNIFSNDTEQLLKHPTLLVASQVIFYAPDVTEFIEKITKHMGGVAILIGQADGSFLNYVGKNFDNSSKKTDSEETVTNTLSELPKFNDIKLLYSSVIDFPKDGLNKNELKVIAYSDFNKLEGNNKLIRCLLEFIAGSPMERLICLERIDNFIDDIYQHLEINEHKISFWNFLSIIVPEEKINEQEMLDKWHKMQQLLLSGNVTSFESALNEGNYEIMLTLFNQGLVTCELYQYQENLLMDFKNRFFSFIRYSLRLDEGYQLFANMLGFELDEAFQFRNYNHPTIQQIQNTKYSFNLRLNVAEKLNKEASSVIADGIKYADMFNPLIHNKYTGSILLIIPFIVMNNIENAAIMASSFFMMYAKIYNNFIFVDNNIIDRMNGDSLIFQLFLFDHNNLNRFKYQNSIGQTPLHLAIANQDTEKAYKLLCCDEVFIEQLIKIRDISGKLPLHYAAEANDVKIANILINKKSPIDDKAYSITQSILNYIFVAGKITYLYSYFLGKNNCNHIPFLLWPAYIFLEYNNISFPENLYFHSFLLQLNPFGEQGNYLYKKTTDCERNSGDTALHLAAKNNNQEIIELLLNTGANPNLLNNKGESALHFAAANHNLAIINLLLATKNIDINIQNIEFVIYPMVDYALKLFFISSSTTSFLDVIGQSFFMKATYNQFSGKYINYPTVLHYAISSNYNNFETIEYLIRNGANPNLSMNKYINYDWQILLYLGMSTLSSSISGLNGLHKITALVIAQSFFGYVEEAIKPIDLIKKSEYFDQKSCQEKENITQLLEQFTVMNQYKSIGNNHLYHFLYWFGLYNDRDSINIDKFGNYAGGSGQDYFIINKDFSGKKLGYKVIISDFSSEDIITCIGCENNNFTTKEALINNHYVVIMDINQELEVYLIG